MVAPYELMNLKRTSTYGPSITKKPEQSVGHEAADRAALKWKLYLPRLGQRGRSRKKGRSMHPLIERVSKMEVDTYQGAIKDANIREIEAKTGCILPDDYIEFVKVFGFASWEHSVFGVYDNSQTHIPPSYNFSAITQTERARAMHASDKYPAFSESIVIGTDCMGGYFLLVSTTSTLPDRVLWVSHDELWVVTERWKSFYSYLEYQLSGNP